MLKKLFVTMALVGVTAYSYGQGTVNFDTKAVNAKVFLPTTSSPANTPAAGTGFWAQLYAAAGVNAPAETLAKAGSPVNLRGGGNAGFVVISGGSTVTVPTTTPGGSSTVQLRAWSANADSYELAIGQAGKMWGASDTLILTSTGNSAAEPPTTPVDLTGLSNVQLLEVPEPSTIALGVLGAAALAFARRRK